MQHRAGELAQAEGCYLTLLEALPGNADLWHLAGVLAFQQGRLEPAIERYGKALALRPAFAQAFNSLALALKQSGRVDEAARALAAALEAQPGYGAAAYNLALIREAARDDAAAEPLYRLALQSNPDWAAARGNLGNLLRRTGRLDEAQEHLQRAAALAPQDADAVGNLALLRLEQGRSADARALAQRALGLAPASARWWEAAGSAARLQGDVDAAIGFLERAAALSPEDPQLLLELALAQEASGDWQAARASLARGLARAPDWERARWTEALLLPRIPAGEDEIAAALRGFDAGLARLDAQLRLDSGEALDGAFDAACSVLPYGLHYLPGDHRARQDRFGDLVARAARAKYPRFADPPSAAPRGGRRIRVGFVSSHLRNHVVERYFGRFLLELDPEAFERFAWSTSGASDERTRAIESGVDHFHGGEREVGEIAAEIREARLDVLVHLDVGLDPRSGVLAALRLAPVQAALPGHPVSTGLDSIDFFLSGDALEPPGAEGDYRERLVRLPGLGCAPRPAPSGGDGAWARALVQDGRPLFFCLQNLAKLTPAFDDVLARIAAGSGGRIVFFNRGQRSSERFARRIAPALARHGAPPSSLHIEPVHPHADFAAGLAHATLVLDTPNFSGGATSLDALGAGAAVLALEGRTARARQTAAMLRLAGCPEWVARDTDEYAASAIALAGGEGLASARSRIAAASAGFFDGRAAIAAFAEFLASRAR
jgi:predicted O-linked N-acetylglucosamine transferase (SPINDLY family)